MFEVDNSFIVQMFFNCDSICLFFWRKYFSIFSEHIQFSRLNTIGIANAAHPFAPIGNNRRHRCCNHSPCNTKCQINEVPYILLPYNALNSFIIIVHLMPHVITHMVPISATAQTFPTYFPSLDCIGKFGMPIRKQRCRQKLYKEIFFFIFYNFPFFLFFFLMNVKYYFK